jgi:hypothetical protein
MTDNVYLNRDKTKVVPATAEGKKWQVPRKEAIRLGLLDAEEKPPQTRRKPETNGTPTRRKAPSKGLNRGLNEDA